MTYTNYLFLLLIFACSCGDKQAGSTTAANTDTAEEWESYLANYAGGKGSVIVNMSLHAIAPAAQYPYLLITGVKFSKCEDGLPAKAAFAGLYQISDSVATIVKENAKGIMAGTFTHQCKRLDYYYLADTAGIRAKLTKMYVLAFPGYEASIHIAPDKDWDAYLKLLYPNAAAKARIEDQKVVDNLLSVGDDITKPRPVDYGLYFPTDAARATFITYAQQQGYKVESQTTATGHLPYELTISKISPVDIELIGNTGIELNAQAAKQGGEYDGWGCGVVK